MYYIKDKKFMFLQWITDYLLKPCLSKFTSASPHLSKEYLQVLVCIFRHKRLQSISTNTKPLNSMSTKILNHISKHLFLYKESIYMPKELIKNDSSSFFFLQIWPSRGHKGWGLSVQSLKARSSCHGKDSIWSLILS